MGAGVPLTKALASLRAELREAVEAGEGDDLKLRVEGLEVELSLEISGEANAEVSGSFWTVLTAKAGTRWRRRRAHRVTLMLKPEWLDAAGSRTPLDLASDSEDDE